MPKLTERARAARQRHILDAARRCFIRHGLVATTVQDICAEAGVSAGGVYTWFDSKRALVDALARRALTDGTALLPDLDHDGAETAGILGARTRHLLDDAAAADDARLDLQLWAAGACDADLGAGCRESIDAVGHALTGVATEAIADGRLDEGLDAQAVGAVLTAIAMGLEVQRALGVELPSAAVADAVTALLDGRWSSGSGEAGPAGGGR